MKNKFLNMIILSMCFVLTSCGSNPTPIPAGDSTTSTSADPTDEDDMRDQLVSGIGFDELATVIHDAKTKDKITTSYVLDIRNDKISSNLVGDKTSIREIRVETKKTKRYENDVIVSEYSGNNELRTFEDGMIQMDYLWCDLKNFYKSIVYTKNEEKKIVEETLFPYDIIKYQTIMYLGQASMVEELTTENYANYTLAGHLSDGRIYARKQLKEEKTIIINAGSFKSQDILAEELFYKDNFLNEIRLSSKTIVDSDDDGLFNLVYKYETQSFKFSQGNNGKYDLASIPTNNSVTSI